jgi:hypothetical protein
MKFLLPLSIIFLLISCSSGNSQKPAQDSSPQQPQQVVTPEFKKGDFTDLYVTNDPANSYSVYLPSNYDAQKKYPMIVFFDAHGNGKLPLNNYKSLAEKWGFIFVGSNSSKNGLDMDLTIKIGNELLDETKAILSVDENQILLCGFSGGSRVAAYMTAGRPDVKGVICNSAAPQAPLPGKTFVGLAGLGDMNYLEMKKFVDGQTTNTSPHDLLVFNGKHEWAPLNMMEDALLIATIYHPVIKNTSQDSAMSFALEKNIIQQSDSLKKTSCLLAFNLTVIGNNSILVKSKVLSANQASLTNCAKSDEAVWAKVEQDETKMQEELGSAIMQQDTTWWKTNADKYFETKSTGPEKFMRQRLRGYASLMCYSYANQAMKANNLHAAEKLVAVYSIVDPTNSEWAYMRATLYMNINLPDYAVAMLDKAVALGFNDRTRLLNDPTFTSLQANPKFSEVMDKMK